MFLKAGRALRISKTQKSDNCITNKKYRKLKKTVSILSKSESVKFSLVESVISLFTELSVETIFFTVKSVNFHCLISENNIFRC